GGVPPLSPGGVPPVSTVLNPGSGSGKSALVWGPSRLVDVIGSRTTRAIARWRERVVRRGAPAQYTGSGAPWQGPYRSGARTLSVRGPVVGEERLGSG